MGFGYALEQHGAEKHTNVTRELFILALNDSNANATLIGTGIELADGVESWTSFTFKVPDDFVSFVSAKIVWRTVIAIGNMRWRLRPFYNAAGEVFGIHMEPLSFGETVAGGIEITNVQEPANPLTLPSLAKGDVCTIYMVRDGAHANDTIDDVIIVSGLLFTYIAEQ